MQTTVLNEGDLGSAIDWLRQGEVVAFPTETVYGLGADGLDAVACAKIFEVKGRPSDNPLILHVLGVDGLEQFTRGPVPALARALTNAFWPGPLTIVLPSNREVPSIVRAGLDTVAIRAPAHPVARTLIEALGHPVAAPSANRSGRPSPTTAQAVLDDLNGRIRYIVDGGQTLVGVESTVVDCTTQPLTLLRPGGLSLEMITSVVGEVQLSNSEGPARSPGMKYRHYAPKAPVIWIQSRDRDFVRKTLDALQREYGTIALASPEPLGLKVNGGIVSLGPDETSAAHRLFYALRQLDSDAPSAIAVVWDSNQGIGRAVANRVEKAAAGRVVAP